LARGEAGADPQRDVAPGGGFGQDEDSRTPDAEAIARDAIDEVKREAEEAKRALDERRHQAKLEGRRVIDKRHRKTTLGMKEKAANYQAKRSSAKRFLAIAVVVMIGVAAFIGAQDVLPFGPGGSGATSRTAK
jgi:hypothetical protein